VAIRVAGVDVSDDVRADIRRKLGRQIGKFALSIERVTVRLSDVNGPRGGMDQQCQVKVVLSGAPSVVVESQSATMHAAIASAIAGVARAVRKRLQRQRTRPRHRARSEETTGARP
jgi:ribosome-associated translation inhibitor RaiA